MPSMIFHTSYKLNPDSISASAIRPIRMLQGFKDAGYDVFDLTGTSRERKRKFKDLKYKLAQGVKFDFMYSESATIPPMVGDPSHFPHLFLDRNIFRTVSKFGVPSGVFYRDVYWAFDEYVERVGRPIATAMKQMYDAELRLYNRYMDVVYVPSLEMAEYTPQLVRPKVVPLPPGGDIIDTDIDHDHLEIFYIGGIGGHYRLHNLMKAVKAVPEMHFTLCTGKAGWNVKKHEYPEADSPNIDIVHKSGDDRDPLYGKADICYIAMEPEPYGAFAVPVKQYEYVGRGKPVIAMKGTLVAKFVEDNQIGWVTDNSPQSLQELLEHLKENRDEVERARQNILKLREVNTWQDRVNQVATELTSL